jgi:hypothetical protein
MTDLEKEIRRWILRALLSAKGPMPEDALVDSIRARFSQVAFTAGDLKRHIIECEGLDFIAGTDDGFGRMWDLTTKGKIKAQQLL